MEGNTARRLLGAAATALLLGSLSACGKWEAPPVTANPPADPAAVSAAQSEEAASAPVTGTMWYSSGNTVGNRRLCDYYIDVAQGTRVFVDYPDYFASKDAAALLRQAAYHDRTMEELAEISYTQSTVDYQVTRDDGRYFSVAFSFFYSSQRGAHPSTDEYALTLDRTTDRPISLSDVLTFADTGELAALIQEKFTPLGNWSDLPSMADLAADYTDPAFCDFSNSFYLTDNSLCLIVQDFSYHFVLEAPYSSLPLSPSFEP